MKQAGYDNIFDNELQENQGLSTKASSEGTTSFLFQWKKKELPISV